MAQASHPAATGTRAPILVVGEVRGDPTRPHLEELVGEEVVALPLGFLQGVCAFQLYKPQERTKGQLLGAGDRRLWSPSSRQTHDASRAFRPDAHR